MWVLRRSRTSLLVCGLAVCLLVLNFIHQYSNIFDLVSYLTSPGINIQPLSLQCNRGRLGNQMCTYASLYGISVLNHRRPTFLSCNINHLKHIFVGPSKVSTKHSSLYFKWHPWNLLSYLRPEDEAIPVNSNFLSGFKYPCSYTFYDHVRNGIRQEFRFQDHFNRYAQTVLHRANFQQLYNATYVGVHVRRGDYKKAWLEAFEGVPVNMEYFRQAVQYFRGKYKNVIFVAVSDDRKWCSSKLAEEFGVHVTEEAPSPAHDLAILANCNHTVMTYGTFGFWGAYLAGGETLYFDKFLKPNTSFTLKKFLFEKMYPPHWKGIVTVSSSLWSRASNTSSAKNVNIQR